MLVESVPADSPALTHAIASMGAMGRSNVYAGLREAFEAVHRHADPLANGISLKHAAALGRGAV